MRLYDYFSILMVPHFQWVKCNRTQGNAVHPPPIYGSERSPTSDWQC